MKPVGSETKTIAKESPQIEHFRQKMGKKMQTIESRLTSLTKNAWAKLDTLYKERSFKGEIAPNGQEVIKIQNLIQGK